MREATGFAWWEMSVEWEMTGVVWWEMSEWEAAGFVWWEMSVEATGFAWWAMSVECEATVGVWVVRQYTVSISYRAPRSSVAFSSVQHFVWHQLIQSWQC